MGKRFKKRFSSLYCCMNSVSDALDLEVKDVKAKESNQSECQPVSSTADANRLFLKQTERRLMKENLFLKKLETLHECLDQSVIDLGCKLKGIIRMDKAILQRYVEIMGDFVVTQESAHIPIKDDVKRKEIVNERQLKDFNNVLTEDIGRETKALLYDIRKRNMDHEKRVVDVLQGHNLSTNASVPLMGAETETAEAFSHTYPINDSPLKYRELTPRIDVVKHFPQTSTPSRYDRKTESCNLNIYNPDDVFRRTEHTSTKPNQGIVVTLPVKYETHQTLECARYMSQREIGFYNPSACQESVVAWDASFAIHSTLDGIANKYTVMVVREENEGLHLPVNTSGHQSCLQGPVWVFSFTPKTRILQSYQHQKLERTMGNKKHVITICVRPLLTRRLDQYGLTKEETLAILNRGLPFWIENPSMSTLPFAPASLAYRFKEFFLTRQGIMQVETSHDRKRKYIFQTERLTDQEFSLATVKVATVFAYDEPIIPIAVPMRVHNVLSQRQIPPQINGPSRNVHKVISNVDSIDAVTHLVVPLLHSTNHTHIKREEPKPLVMISTVRSLKELCQMVSDKITTPKPRQSENMVKQCSKYPVHTDQESSKDLAANVASSDNKADEHCGDGDQQGSGGSPRLINENTSTCVLIKTDASPKSDGRHMPNEYVRLQQSSAQHAERSPKAPRPEKVPVGLTPTRSCINEGNSRANVKDESMQDIAKLVSFKIRLPEVKEDLLKGHRFFHKKSPMLSLKYLMGTGFHLEEIHAKFLSINLLHILKFLLDRRIIHADISPDKIVFNNKGYPCLIGYEKSEIIRGCRRDSKFTIPKIEFCSPEQFCKKDEITEATDVFSTGVLVYRMLYGRSPHQDVNYQKTKANLLKNSFIPRFKPDGILSWTGKLFIAHCIRRDPNQRFSIKRCQSSLVDSVKWFKGLDEPDLINQKNPSPFSEFLHGNQNTASSCTTTTSGTTTTSTTTITFSATGTFDTSCTSGTIGTFGTTRSSGTDSSTPVSKLQAMAKKASIKPTRKLPTRIRTQRMVNRLSSQRPTNLTPQHMAA